MREGPGCCCSGSHSLWLHISFSRSIDVGTVPNLAQLGFAREAPEPARLQGLGRLKGGEGEAKRHVQAFILDVKAAASELQQGGSHSAHGPRHFGREQTSDACFRGHEGVDLQGSSPGPTFSCKISPWLALGCVSPRTVSSSP